MAQSLHYPVRNQGGHWDEKDNGFALFLAVPLKDREHSQGRDPSGSHSWSVVALRTFHSTVGIERVAAV